MNDTQLAIIQQGLKQLLNQKPYDKITVSDICAKTNISRRTFYKYFNKAEDIIVKQIHDDFVAPVHNLRDILPIDEIKSSQILMLEKLCTTIYANKEYYRAILHYRGRYSLVETIVAESRILNEEVYTKRIKSPDEFAFVSYLFAWVIPIVLLWALNEDSDIDPKRIAKYVNRWAFANWSEIDKEKFS